MALFFAIFLERLPLKYDLNTTLFMNKLNNLVSIVIPIYNECESVELLTKEILKVMNANNIYFELILVNDGSNDSTLQILNKLSLNIKELKVLNLRKNYRQTAAMAAGFDYTNGEIIISLDGDLKGKRN